MSGTWIGIVWYIEQLFVVSGNNYKTCIVITGLKAFRAGRNEYYTSVRMYVSKKNRQGNKYV